jgi:putative FmdB family regulatory protein
MPNYDFICCDCNKIFEVFKKNPFNEFELVCPDCGSLKAKRVYSIPMTDVAIGQYGNNSNGYAKEPTYFPSKFGKFKGTRVK